MTRGRNERLAVYGAESMCEDEGIRVDGPDGGGESSARIRRDWQMPALQP